MTSKDVTNIKSDATHFTLPQTVFSIATPDNFSQFILFNCIAFPIAPPNSGGGGGGGGAGPGGGGGGGGIAPGGGY